MKNSISTVFVFSVFLMLVLSCADSGDSSYNGRPLVSTDSNANANNAIARPIISPTPKINSPSKSATVITENAGLRKSAGQSGEITETLPEGSTVEVVRRKGAWFYVRSAGGQQGWMHGNTIRYVSSSGNTGSTTAPKPGPARPPKPEAPIVSNPSGASARCRDGTLSYSQSRRGTCSHHGGVAVWY